MNDFVAGLTRWLLQAVLVLMGLVFFLSLLVAVLVLALLWGLRALWARLTGQPVTPFVMQVDPRTGWRTVYRSSSRWSSAASGGRDTPGDDASDPPVSRRGGVLPGAADVSDVEPKEPR